MNARSGRTRPLQARIHPFLIVLLLMASEARAQTTSALLREGDVLGTSGTVSSINNPSVNHVGGFSVQVNTTTGTTTLSHIWGNATGGSGAILLTENTYGNWLQTAFESFNGLTDRGEACYGVTATNLSNGTTGLDGVFMDQTAILMGREPVPTIPGFYSTFNSRPGCTSGEPYWVGGITNVPNSSTSQNRVLFFG
ncbi:MAG TPA: hypothetical protein VFO11_09030, partial [Candidatus Polarisedimenticolaceae bacterium]|nr:hypothetical protein [Candidatus Polarisedimenticolaceae bacterium]